MRCLPFFTSTRGVRDALNQHPQPPKGSNMTKTLALAAVLTAFAASSFAQPAATASAPAVAASGAVAKKHDGKAHKHEVPARAASAAASK